ncbi:unnamed protein product [Protopolystoma xenopodis]|uniref:Uncharacterized protein n=1 Tax=Protopolystoma xenopodis TaxID=117903 RepID=A0A3S5CGZ3_9PLAT|nr:unnamed protein product [Protopolystoma xenopodis]
MLFSVGGSLSCRNDMILALRIQEVCLVHWPQLSLSRKGSGPFQPCGVSSGPEIGFEESSTLPPWLRQIFYLFTPTPGLLEASLPNYHAPSCLLIQHVHIERSAATWATSGWRRAEETSGQAAAATGVKTTSPHDNRCSSHEGLATASLGKPLVHGSASAGLSTSHPSSSIAASAYASSSNTMLPGMNSPQLNVSNPQASCLLPLLRALVTCEAASLTVNTVSLLPHLPQTSISVRGANSVPRPQEDAKATGLEKPSPSTNLSQPPVGMSMAAFVQNIAIFLCPSFRQIPCVPNTELCLRHLAEANSPRSLQQWLVGLEKTFTSSCICIADLDHAEVRCFASPLNPSELDESSRAKMASPNNTTSSQAPLPLRIDARITNNSLRLRTCADSLSGFKAIVQALLPQLPLVLPNTTQQSTSLSSSQAAASASNQFRPEPGKSLAGPLPHGTVSISPLLSSYCMELIPTISLNLWLYTHCCLRTILISYQMIGLLVDLMVILPVY